MSEFSKEQHHPPCPERLNTLRIKLSSLMLAKETRRTSAPQRACPKEVSCLKGLSRLRGLARSKGLPARRAFRRREPLA